MVDPESDYAEFLFPNYSSSGRSFWVSIMNFINALQDYNFLAVLVISGTGVLINCFHFLILTRKSMMTSSINILLLAICVFDLTGMGIGIGTICYSYLDIYFRSSVPLECAPPTPLYLWRTLEIVAELASLTDRSSAWIITIMAVIRALVIKFPLNERISNFSKIRCGVLIIVTVLLLILPFCCLEYSQQIIKEGKDWHPGKSCANFPQNYTQTTYHYAANPVFAWNFELVYEFIFISQGLFFKFVPSAVLLISTVILVSEMRKAASRQEILLGVSRKDSNRTTKLVTYIAISFLVGQTPLGICSWMKTAFLSSPGFLEIIKGLQGLFGLVPDVSTITYVLICFLMSSQYQETVRSLLGKKKASFARMTSSKTSNLARVE